MLSFCGSDNCKMDANGRIKLSGRFLADFERICRNRIVMHCLPEGAVALYPEEIFAEMRRKETAGVERAAASLVARRSMRRFGAQSLPDEITPQGRVTLPQSFREFAKLCSGEDVCVVGVEIGVEIWNAKRWQQELETVNADALTKGEREVARDLMDTETNGKESEEWDRDC